MADEWLVCGVYRDPSGDLFTGAQTYPTLDQALQRYEFDAVKATNTEQVWVCMVIKGSTVGKVEE